MASSAHLSVFVLYRLSCAENLRRAAATSSVRQTGTPARIAGGRQFERVRVAQFALLPTFVEQSDAIAMLPRRVAERFAAHAAIRIAKLPFPSEPVPICMFWNELKHNDPAHRWLRDLLLGLPVD